MKNRPRGGLGRGLGALIPTAPPQPSGGEPAADATASPPDSGEAAPVDSAPAHVPPAELAVTPGVTSALALAPVPGARFAEIPVGSIVPNPKQPRHVFDEEAMEELKTSIQEVGLLQP